MLLGTSPSRRLRSAGSSRAALVFVPLLVAVAFAGFTSSADAFRVAVLGDIGCPPRSGTGFWHDPPGPEMLPEAGRCRSTAVARRVATERPRFTLVAGDMVHGPNATSSVYGRRVGLFRRILDGRIFSSPGNHDSRKVAGGGRDFAGYFRYWLKRSRHPFRIGRPGRSWASYDVGRWHFVSLNSNCRLVDCTLTGPQIRWLKRDLRRDRDNPATSCTLAYMHHPRFSSGAKLGRTGDRMLVSNLWEVLYRYRTDLLLTGHQHYYERFVPLNPGGKPDPTGITQYITGTGGSSVFRPAGEYGRTATGSAASRPAFGATILTLGRRGYRSKFLTVGGREIDAMEQPVRCLNRNAGVAERRPRMRRYRQRMRRLRSLRLRVRRLSRKARRLSGAAARRTTAVTADRRIGRRIAQLRKRRERLLNKPLYR